MSKISIAAVSYLNTKPFLKGLYSSKVIDQIDLSVEIPSECARKLVAGEVDLALSPVAIIPKLKDAKIYTPYCIGADREVQTVAICSNQPLEEVSRIYLDYQSRTSVKLAHILLKEYWRLDVEYIAAEPGFEQLAETGAAAVIIGDRVYEQELEFKYKYDLAKAWHDMTGLGFVFAAWIANKELPENFVLDFSAALKNGLGKIDEVVEEEQPRFRDFDVHHYLHRVIQFELNESREMGMKLFLEKIS